MRKGRLSSLPVGGAFQPREGVPATGKSPEPAGWKAYPTQSGAIVRIAETSPQAFDKHPVRINVGCHKTGLVGREDNIMTAKPKRAFIAAAQGVPLLVIVITGHEQPGNAERARALEAVD